MFGRFIHLLTKQQKICNKSN